MKNIIVTLAVVIILAAAGRFGITTWNNYVTDYVEDMVDESMESDNALEAFIVNNYYDVEYDYDRGPFGIITGVKINVGGKLGDSHTEHIRLIDLIGEENEA